MRETKVADYRYDTDILFAVFPPAKLQEEDCHYENTEQGYLLLRLPAFIHYCSQQGYYHLCIVLCCCAVWIDPTHQYFTSPSNCAQRNTASLTLKTIHHSSHNRNKAITCSALQDLQTEPINVCCHYLVSIHNCYTHNVSRTQPHKITSRPSITLVSPRSHLIPKKVALYSKYSSQNSELATSLGIGIQNSGSDVTFRPTSIPKMYAKGANGNINVSWQTSPTISILAYGRPIPWPGSPVANKTILLASQR